MYQSELKARFIRQYTNSANTALRCESLFDIVESVESELGKDVCTMTDDEFSGVLSLVCGVKHSTGTRMSAFLRDYIKWCVDTDVSGANQDLLTVEFDQTDNMRDGMYKSPSHLQHVLDSLFYPVSEGTFHNALRCYIWLAYIGLQQKEIEIVEKTNVDFASNTVHSASGAHSIYMEAIPTFLSCVNETSFRYFHNKHGGLSPRERADSALLLARTKSTVKSQELINSICAVTRAKESNASFRYDRLLLSGVFYRMYLRETEDGIPVDFHLFAQEFVLAKRMFKSSKYDESAEVRKTAFMFKQDYAAWKVAFGL